MSNVGFLFATCWLDADGKHVWLRHKCRDGFTETMLPWPTWHAAGDRVEPSIFCDDCGLHVFAQLGEPPAQEETAND